MNPLNSKAQNEKPFQGKEGKKEWKEKKEAEDIWKEGKRKCGDLKARKPWAAEWKQDPLFGAPHAPAVENATA